MGKMGKRTRLKIIVASGDRYKQYRSLEEWLESTPVKVTKVENVDKDTLAVFYENVSFNL